MKIREFLQRDSSSGIVILITATLAMICANTALSSQYFSFLDYAIKLDFIGLKITVHHFINDVLMVLFFYVVGLEIKRELTTGHLASRKKALAPFIAALGGMAVPAVIYLLIAGGTEPRGWGIAVATDIALAVGLLALVGKGAPESLRVFLLALAVIDDIGAILIIALVYSAGLHPTLIGVVLGLLTPRMKLRNSIPLNEWLEHKLHPISAFIVIPLFAFANAGVKINSEVISIALGSLVAWGIFAGLVIGKPVGILLTVLAAARLKLADIPIGANKRLLGATGSAAGIGFTVSIFIAQLAFEDKQLQEIAILAVIAASIISGVLSALIFKFSARLTAP